MKIEWQFDCLVMRFGWREMKTRSWIWKMSFMEHFKILSYRLFNVAVGASKEKVFKLQFINSFPDNLRFLLKVYFHVLTWYISSSPGGSKHSNSQHRSPTRNFLQNCKKKRSREKRTGINRGKQLWKLWRLKWGDLLEICMTVQFRAKSRMCVCVNQFQIGPTFRPFP